MHQEDGWNDARVSIAAQSIANDRAIPSFRRTLQAAAPGKFHSWSARQAHTEFHTRETAPAATRRHSGRPPQPPHWRSTSSYGTTAARAHRGTAHPEDGDVVDCDDPELTVDPEWNRRLCRCPSQNPPREVRSLRRASR